MKKKNENVFDVFLADVKKWEASVKNGPKNPRDLVENLKKNGYKVIDTRGLPFNGTTFEVSKPIPGYQNAYQVCGHIKYIVGIYSSAMNTYIYPPTCKGGKLLNGYPEGDLYEHVIKSYDSTHPCHDP